MLGFLINSISDMVRKIAFTLEEPRSIEYIANQADVTVEEARNIIESLQNEGYVKKQDDGYRTNMVKIYEEQVSELCEGKTTEQIRNELQSVKSRIKSIKDRYNVKNISQLDNKVREDDLNDDYRKEMSKKQSNWMKLIYRKHMLLEALDRKNS